MQLFSFQHGKIVDLILIQPFIAPDERGYLLKSFEKKIFAQHGIQIDPYEELTSFSHKGVLRGLHFQRKNSQDKLVRVLHGAVYDVAVDLRADSPTFGQWEGFYLSAKNKQMLYIPKGFAHGFLALEEQTTMNYLLGDQYIEGMNDGIIWNDPELDIPWPLEQIDTLLLSARDKKFLTFSQFCTQWGILPCRGTL